MSSAVEVSSREVLLNTQITLTCKITRIIEIMSIEWTGFVEEDKNEYVPSSGSYDPQTNSQTGTLTVQFSAVTSDKTYTCTVSSIQNTESDSNNFDIHLNVYGMLSILQFDIVIYLKDRRLTKICSDRFKEWVSNI